MYSDRIPNNTVQITGVLCSIQFTWPLSGLNKRFQNINQANSL